MLKVGTLFSGGLAAVEWALKYEELEHEIVFACEWDKYARKQYLAFHGEPTSNFYQDVSDMDGKPYRDTLDLMVWGSPCQDLSLAGKRKGFDGAKSSLFREGARIMSEVMPKAFIFENVIGLLSSNGGNDYKEVEKTFRDMGYHILLGRINAKEQGTAQNRDRVFIVGFLDVEDYHNFHFADSVPLTKCLRDYLDDEVDEKYYLSQKMIDGFISHGSRHKEKGTGFQWNPKNGDDIANCLRANAAICPTDNTIKVKAKFKVQALHNKDDSHCACLTARYYKMGKTDPYILEPKKIGFINQNTQASTVFSSDGVSPTICSGTHGYAQGYVLDPKLNQVGELNIKGADSTKRVYGVDGLCPTMTTMGGGNRQPKVLLPTIEVGVKSATKSGYEVATENDSINFTHPNSTTRRGRVGRGVAQTLDCACNQAVIEPIVCEIRKDEGIRTFDDNICGTLHTIDACGNKHVIKDFRIRRLTPKECFRLMGMKDEDIKLVNSDTQSYKIAGNGIEINTMRSIVRQLYKPVKSVGSLF